MKIIYLDQNIWLDILLKRTEPYLSDIENKIDRKKVGIVYSPANCEEICNSYRSLNIEKHITYEEKEARIDLLSKLSRNTSILPYCKGFDVKKSPFGFYGPHIVSEHPSACFKRVNDNYSSNEGAEDAQKQSLDTGGNVSTQEKSKLGNINPVDILINTENGKNKLLKNIESKLIHKTAINQLISEGHEVQPFTGAVRGLLDLKALSLRTLKGDYFLNKAIKIMASNNIFNLISKKFDDTEAVIDAVMLTLIELGYASEKNPMSSLHDNTHAIYGSFCDYFVTRDNKLIKKLKPTYDLLRVETKIINANEENWLNILS